jgi:DNA-directed RNA polymerase specialized sigma subunit
VNLPPDTPAPKDPLQSAYENYTSAQTPENLHAVVSHLKPTIQYTLASIGSGDDPYLRGKAKLIAAKAIQKYNPSAGASIPTWVSGQLMQMRRMKRLSQLPLKIPERTQLNAYHLLKTEMEFTDKHGREPDVNELADASGMPIKHIARIRRIFKKMPTEEEVGDDFSGASMDFTGEAMDYLHGDLDYIDRKILEHKTGYGGAPIIPGPALGAKLRLTPTQLSRRSARISLRLQEIERNLGKTIN